MCDPANVYLKYKRISNVFDLGKSIRMGVTLKLRGYELDQRQNRQILFCSEKFLGC